MNTSYSKSALVYRQVKCHLRSGHYAPGQRIDPAMLATQFRTSPTPVRFALYRLVGEGLVADHARGGLQVPLLNEVALRDLYDWMERLLLMACDRNLASAEHRHGTSDATLNGDMAKRTWQLFDAMARATMHDSLQRAICHANDRLAPVRRAKQSLVKQTQDELSQLMTCWQKSDIPALKSALRDYHEHRKKLVPCIVSLLSERAEDLH
ncbi:GntR family transcriptional regulator [Oleiagrimonas sp. C23AA]|uniref:GntR family transcriptional regulator n=1 Tax=Oleiagrimonas sp. C23AA TaxID=2719047 RepID=UPI00142491CD|nr:GntR family transcriptional regulator [Oleiagrimonas sp. C23AA]NII09496.1 GntR family transcriptional regulator [Oleiagrimonas sp. C23AA]